jgi:hypothetical protein
MNTVDIAAIVGLISLYMAHSYRHQLAMRISEKLWLPTPRSEVR